MARRWGTLAALEKMTTDEAYLYIRVGSEMIEASTKGVVSRHIILPFALWLSDLWTDRVGEFLHTMECRQQSDLQRLAVRLLSCGVTSEAIHAAMDAATQRYDIPVSAGVVADAFAEAVSESRLNAAWLAERQAAA